MQSFRVLLFLILYKKVLTFYPVGETLACDHSTKKYRVVLLGGTVYHAVPVGCNLLVPDKALV